MRTLVSCVIDEQPKFFQQALRLVASLSRWTAENEVTVVLHHLGELPSPLRNTLSSRGVLLTKVRAFGKGPAVYCNKLQQFESVLSLDAENIVLCDADVIFLESPAALVMPGSVSARIVDRPNPRAAALRALLDCAGYQGEPLSASPAFAPGERTHRYNCNGGMYALGVAQLERLAEPWRRWAAFCLEQEALLGPKVMHADQLGFMLAMLETGLPFANLPGHANFPTHLAPDLYTVVPPRLSSLHYHGRVEGDGLLAERGLPALDRWISTANRSLAESGLLPLCTEVEGERRC